MRRAHMCAAAVGGPLGDKPTLSAQATPPERHSGSSHGTARKIASVVGNQGARGDTTRVLGFW